MNTQPDCECTIGAAEALAAAYDAAADAAADAGAIAAFIVARIAAHHAADAYIADTAALNATKGNTP